MDNVLRKVLLPQWIFDQAGDDNEKLSLLVVSYMTRYKGYRIIEIKKPFALCKGIGEW